MNTEKAKVSPLYLQLIEGMHQDKLKINDAKLARHGSIDIDDHGFIDFSEFTFEPETCEDGLVHGCACIGRNFSGKRTCWTLRTWSIWHCRFC